MKSEAEWHAIVDDLEFDIVVLTTERDDLQARNRELRAALRDTVHLLLATVGPDDEYGQATLRQAATAIAKAKGTE